MFKTICAFTICLFTAACTKVVINPNSPSPSPAATSAPSATPAPTSAPSATPVPTTKPTDQPQPQSVYTQLQPSSDTKMIYVAANGLDTNPGTIAQPVLTVFKGVSLLRKGMPDWLLFRRGDKFKQSFYSDPVGLSFNLSGRSATEPMVITSYSDPKAPSSVRPEFNTGTSSGFVTYGSSNVALVGLNFHDSLRDPNSTDFVGPVTSAPTGLRFGGNTLNWLIEDCVFDSYGQGMTIDAVGDKTYNFSNIKVRYNIIKNSYSNNRAQGIYIGATNGITIEGNILDHNGWTEQTSKTGTWNFMAQNHNVYFRQDNTGVAILNNFILKGADCGIELRAGGLAQGNVLDQNMCGMTVGLVNGATLLKDGITAEVSNNVVLDGRADTTGSTCFEVGNTKSLNLHDNICAREVNDPKMYGYALSFEAGNGVSNPTDGSGVSNATIQNNIFYAWSSGWYMEADLVGGAAGSKGFNGLVVQNNAVQAMLRKTVQHEAKVDLTHETFAKNIYSASAGQAKGIFQIGVSNAVGTTSDWATFVKVVEPTATYQAIAYTDPANASIEAYNQSVGGTGTYDAFVAEVEKQSALSFQQARTTAAVVAFVKSKFAH